MGTLGVLEVSILVAGRPWLRARMLGHGLIYLASLGVSRSF